MTLLTKVCTDCGIEKPVNDFYFCNKKKGYRFGRCKPCHNAYSIINQRRQDANRTKPSIVEKRNLLIEFFAAGCADCGTTDIEVLECDHVRGTKTANVTKILYWHSVERMKEELKLCVPRCGNCHKKKTIQAVIDSGRTHWRRMGL